MEKTFIDCLFKPDYAGGIVEIARALYVVREKLDYRKLWDYTQKFRSQAVIKRLGFLLELLEIRHPIIEQLQQAKSNAYTVLDTELPQEGKRSSRWNIQQNMDAETIKSAILT